MKLRTQEEEKEALRRLVEHATVREVDKFHLVMQSIKEKQRQSK